MQRIDDQQLIRRLRPLIGNRYRYLQQEWSLVEVLVDEGSLVLSSLPGGYAIQHDQSGRASRRGPETRLIPVFDTRGGGYSEELQKLLANRIGG
ncbi:MAG: hypothetical protein AB2807_12435 [Candidatus Sedimenticola endophacoides]